VTATCSGSPEAGADTPLWQLSATYGVASSELSLSNDEDASVRRRVVSLGIERRLGDRWAIQAGAGASLGGDLGVGDVRYDLAPGWVASLGCSWRILAGEGMDPFLLAALGISVGSALARGPTDEAAFTASDARLSLTAGKVFWQGLAPYAVVRVFGGPVFWRRHDESITGTDKYHVQLGLGLLATAGGRTGAFFELIPLGERSASLGANLAF
jgi:hypothetical protein